MKYVKSYQMFEKDFQDLYKKKNIWIQMLDAGKRKEIAENLYVLVDNSYAPLGGHPSVPDLTAVFNRKLTYWEGIDNDEDRDADAVIFGRKSPFGIKVSGIGHDLQKKSKKELLKQLEKVLNRKGYWIEASDRLAEILYQSNVPYVNNKRDVEEIFRQQVKWLGDKGKYIRLVDAVKKKYHTETVFGNPKL